MKQGASKQITAEQAAELMPDGGVLGTSGFVGAGFAEAVAAALEKRFLETGHPKGITLLFCAGIGDGKSRGLNRLAHDGLVSRIVGGHVGLTPALGKKILGNEIAFRVYDLIELTFLRYALSWFHYMPPSPDIEGSDLG